MLAAFILQRLSGNGRLLYRNDWEDPGVDLRYKKNLVRPCSKVLGGGQIELADRGQALAGVFNVGQAGIGLAENI
jgi:hypothetical protein